MMMQALCSIEVLHEYFSNKRFTLAQLVADPQTLALLARFNLLCRQRDNVFTLYFTGEANVKSFLLYLTEAMFGQPLVFWLCYDAAKFSFITALPLDWVGQIAFSSQDRSSLPGTHYVSLNQNLASRTVFKDNVIARVEIFPKDLLDDIGINYQIGFLARQRYWHYVIVNRSKVKLDTPVISNGSDIEFDSAQKISLESGELAWLFRSGRHQFPMEQRPMTKLNLVNSMAPATGTGQQIERVLLKGLPVPIDEALSVKQDNSQEYIYSTIYVYL